MISDKLSLVYLSPSSSFPFLLSILLSPVSESIVRIPILFLFSFLTTCVMHLKAETNSKNASIFSQETTQRKSIKKFSVSIVYLLRRFYRQRERERKKEKERRQEKKREWMQSLRLHVVFWLQIQTREELERKRTTVLYSFPSSSFFEWVLCLFLLLFRFFSSSFVFFSSSSLDLVLVFAVSASFSFLLLFRLLFSLQRWVLSSSFPSFSSWVAASSTSSSECNLKENILTQLFSFLLNFTRINP